MVRDHAERDVRSQLRVRTLRLGVGDVAPGVLPGVRPPRKLADGREERVPQVDAEVVLLVLEDLGDAFEAHAGVDVLGGQRRELAGRVAVVLDEDEVPDLHDARVFAVDVLAAGLVRRAVDVDLGARAAGAGVAHLPEVVLAEVVDALVGYAAEPLPDVRGFRIPRDPVPRVALEAAHVQPLGVEAPHLGEQLPRHRDGAFLEVVAERPVAEHLEERVVPAGPADVVEVVVLAPGADALLRVRRPAPRRLLGAEEVGLELVHARVREQQRRVVVRDDGRRRHERVPVLLHEEIDVLPTDLAAGGHGPLSSPAQAAQSPGV